MGMGRRNANDTGAVHEIVPLQNALLREASIEKICTPCFCCLPLPMLAFSAVLAYVHCDDERFYGGNPTSCITADECFSQKMYPYTLAKSCISDKPDTDSGLYLNAAGAYECPLGMVTVFNSPIVKCASSFAECTGLFINTNKSACVKFTYNCNMYFRMCIY